MIDLFQSLNRAYKRSDRALAMLGFGTQLFQSLNRAYKRSDRHNDGRSDSASYVSIPQSGLQAFRQCLREEI